MNVIYYKYHYIEKEPKAVTIVCYKLVFCQDLSLTKLFTPRIRSLGLVSVVLFFVRCAQTLMLFPNRIRQANVTDTTRDYQLVVELRSEVLSPAFSVFKLAGILYFYT